MAKIRREVLDSKIITKKGIYRVEETPDFIKAAKLHGFDVFEAPKKRENKKEKVEKNEDDSSNEGAE